MQITGQRKKKKQPVPPPPSTGKPSWDSSASQTLHPQTGERVVFTQSPDKVVKLRPGMVLLKDFIPLPVQQYLLDTCFEKGKAPEGKEAGGFYDVPRSGKLTLNQGHRGRTIFPIEDYPADVAQMCRDWVAAAHKVDPEVKTMDPTTLLVNFYDQKGTFKWHKDTENPELIKSGNGKPIVSVTIGETAVFAWKDRYEDTKYDSCQIESGDVLLFGGPSRMIVHSVLKIVPNTRPSPLRFPYHMPGRLNLTFREVQGVIDTSMFPAYRVAYDIEEAP